jgi:hypothetical protein
MADCDTGCRVHSDIDKVSDEEVQGSVLTDNLTPRTCLSFKTPFQAIRGSSKNLPKT